MQLFKATILSVLLSLGIPQAQADTTNVVQNLNIQLLGVQSSGSRTNRNIVTDGIAQVNIGNRQIIQALGAATGNSFGNRAKLVIVTPLDGGGSTIQVRDGSSQVDVTPFFSHETLSAEVAGSQSNLNNQRTVNLAFSIQRVTLHDAEGFPPLNLHFDVSGYTSEMSQGNQGGVGNLNIDAAGSGDVGGNPTILRGQVDVSGNKLEVVVGTVTANA